MADSPTLSPFYRGWGRHQRTLSGALVGLTAEQLAVRADRYRAIWRIAVHIAGNEVYYFHTIMGEGDDSLLEFVAWDEGGVDDVPPRSGTELERALTTTWALISGCLDRWTPAMLDDMFDLPRADGSSVPVSRQWIIFRVLRHDIHHGGEISLTLGGQGLPGLVF